MKKMRHVLVLLLIVPVVLFVVYLTNAATAPPAGYFKIYYYRFDNTYTDWGVHLWNDDGWSPSTWNSPPEFLDVSGYTGFTQGEEDVNGVAFKYIQFPEPTTPGPVINFIIHKGDLKDMGGEDQLWPTPVTNKAIYCIQGDTTIYTDENSAGDAAVNDISVATLVSSTEIDLSIKVDYVQGTDIVEVWQTNPDQTVDVTISGSGKALTATHNSGTFDYSTHFYTVKFNDRPKKTIFGDPTYMDNDASGLTPTIASLATLQLGTTYTGGNVEFKLWSPFASNVVLNFYSTWDQASTNPDTTYDLTRGVGEGGVWTGTIAEGTANGQLYQYVVHFGTDSKVVLDPYAKNLAQFNESGVDKVGKGVVVNPTDEDPTGWVDGTFASIPGYTKREDAVIYEIHVRDFTSNPNLTTTAQFGTYTAFIEKLGYLQNLGVTHIQLLPVISYYYGNEADNATREMTYSASGNNYNWGYDPHNYFSPEGMYSEDPDNADPGYRIKELKALIKAAHDLGMGVTLDTVYNHQAKVTIMNDIVPGYYYRLNSDGSYTSASGCGNDVATTHKMARKLIVDSLEYWTQEYNVDGYRNDLMGLIDTVTMTDGYNAAAAINSDTLFIGEGWKMYNGPASTIGADQNWMSSTDSIAVFSDSIRDILKSGGFNEGASGLLTGLDKGTNSTYHLIVGDGDNTDNDMVGDLVAYIAAHDGLTWHDTICASMEQDPVDDKEAIFQRMKLGNTIIITAQGISFLHAGQEMGRTKEFKTGTPTSSDLNEMHGQYVRNSYDSADIVNMIDWSLVESSGDGYELMNYTKGLIELKKSTDAFSRGSTVSAILTQTENLAK